MSQHHRCLTLGTVALPRQHCHTLGSTFVLTVATPAWGQYIYFIDFFCFFFVLFFYFFAEYCHRRLNRCFWSLSGMPSLPTVRRCSSSGPHSFTHFGLSVRNSRKVNCPRRVNTVRHPATALPSPAEHTYVYKHYE